MKILEEIVENRKLSLERKGAAQGLTLFEERTVPVVPFIPCSASPAAGFSRINRRFVIAEVKKQSPSAGVISHNFDPIKTAQSYAECGVKNISVLTEEDYFGGSLQYLIDIKKKFPYLSLLRKDFLITSIDIKVSYLAGADAVLLIASVLEKKMLEKLYREAENYGLCPLVEVHTEEDIAKVKKLKPVLTGINCRNLKDFTIDRLGPLITADKIDWDTTLVYESGIRTLEDADLAFSSGFDAVLCGESVMKKSTLLSDMVKLSDKMSDKFSDKFSDKVTKAETNPLFTGRNYFWRKLYARKKPGRPLVKICGITTHNDASAALHYSADMIGMIFADSPRRAPESLPEDIRNLDIIKIAVVKNPKLKEIEYLKKLYQKQLIDAVQFHGEETPEQCASLGIPYYKAFGFSSGVTDIPLYFENYSPRILSDSGINGKSGGTGEMIDNNTIRMIKSSCPGMPLWLAGGLSEQNVREVIEKYSPELVDASSRLEISPGRKDHKKLETFFKELNILRN